MALSSHEGMGGVVLRDNKTQMQKENKRCQRQLKAEQEEVSQWVTHQGNGCETLVPQPHITMEYRNSMCPRGRALAAGLRDSSPNGPQWAALPTQDNHGQRRKSGRWWLVAPISPPYHRRLSHILPCRPPKKFAQSRHPLWHGMI
jgi:hypothetical protein